MGAWTRLIRVAKQLPEFRELPFDGRYGQHNKRLPWQGLGHYFSFLNGWLTTKVS